MDATPQYLRERLSESEEALRDVSGRWVQAQNRVDKLFAGRKKIYIAGPYSKGDVAKNIKTAMDWAELVVLKGHVPFIPHLNHFWNLVHPHEYEFWLAQDIEWLAACDAILRFPGESAGADKEVEWAESHGLKVFTTPADIP